MKNAAVGFRVHSGWSAWVAVCLERGEPLVLCRKRVELVEPFTYELRQPYHTAAKSSLDEGREFIVSVRAQAVQRACGALRELQAEVQGLGWHVTEGVVLLASGRPLPALEHILVSHALIHTADGELFRDALAETCPQCGIKLSRAKEKSLLAEAAKSLRRSESALQKRLVELGKGLGPPWSQDEKTATLAAWLALRGAKKAPQAKRKPA